jgi:hypothetical protein
MYHMVKIKKNNRLRLYMYHMVKIKKNNRLRLYMYHMVKIKTSNTYSEWKETKYGWRI